MTNGQTNGKTTQTKTVQLFLGWVVLCGTTQPLSFHLSRSPEPATLSLIPKSTGPLSIRGSSPMFHLQSLSLSMDVSRTLRIMRTSTREVTMGLWWTTAQSSQTSFLLGPFLDSTQMLAPSKSLIMSSMAMYMMPNKDGSSTHHMKKGRVNRGMRDQRGGRGEKDKRVALPSKPNFVQFVCMSFRSFVYQSCQYPIWYLEPNTDSYQLSFIPDVVSPYLLTLA